MKEKKSQGLKFRSETDLNGICRGRTLANSLEREGSGQKEQYGLSTRGNDDQYCIENRVRFNVLCMEK